MIDRENHDVPLFRRRKREAGDLAESPDAGEPDSPRDEGESTDRGSAVEGTPGEREEPARGAGEGERRDFFEMSPEEARSYRPPGLVIAARKPVNFKPALKALGVAAVLGAVVVGVVFLWPSSEARVPDVTGKTLNEALDGARGAGFNPTVTGWEYSDRYSDGIVLSQKPLADRVVEKGGKISLTVSKGPRSVSPTTGRLPAPAPGQPEDGDSTEAVTHPFAGKVVCIDAGHQATPPDDEWADPGMTRRNPGDMGARGISTGNPEYLVTADIAFKLKSLLEKDGIEVVMTRERSDVNLTNINRAEIANNAEADLYVRIHCGDSNDTARNGSATLYPANTEWTVEFYEASKTAALYVQEELVKSCSTEDLGVFDRHDLSGFNWSRVPVIEAEVAFLSNPDEDALLSTDDFRWKVTWGLRNGIIRYLSNP